MFWNRKPLVLTTGWFSAEMVPFDKANFRLEERIVRMSRLSKPLHPRRRQINQSRSRNRKRNLSLRRQKRAQNQTPDVRPEGTAASN